MDFFVRQGKRLDGIIYHYVENLLTQHDKTYPSLFNGKTCRWIFPSGKEDAAKS